MGQETGGITGRSLGPFTCPWALRAFEGHVTEAVLGELDLDVGPRSLFWGWNHTPSLLA